MIVIIDANVIVANPGLRGSKWEQIADAIAGKRLQVLLPRFAMDEAIAVYQRRRVAKKIEIRSAARHTSKQVQEILEQAALVLDHESQNYPKQLTKSLQRAGVEIHRAPRIGHAALVMMAASRRRPFDEKGSGYRDALHWATVVEVVKDHYEESDIVFISNDQRAFGSSNGDLHPHLLEDLTKYDVEAPYFQWIRTLEELTVPGLFADQLGYEIELTPGELAGFVLSALWDAEPFEITPSSLELAEEPSAVRVMDIVDPHVDEIGVRQYFGADRFRADFNLHLTLNLALWYLSEDDEHDGIREEILSAHFYTAASADFTFGARTTDYVFTNLELEGLRTASPTPPKQTQSTRRTYANGPIMTSPYRESVTMRASD